MHVSAAWLMVKLGGRAGRPLMGAAFSICQRV